MEDHVKREFDGLFAAHCNRSATDAERERLGELAAGDAERVAAVDGMDDLHRLFAAERRALRLAGEPTTVAETGDDGFARLEGAAARAEETLRQRLRVAGAAQPALAVGGGDRRWWLPAAAAAVLIVSGLVWLLGGGVDRPELMPGRPQDQVLGGVGRIVLEAKLSLSEPVLTWHAVVGAASYDVVVATVDGDVVARRTADDARATRYELSRDEVAAVAAARAAPLVLRVAARDGLGSVIASTGDLPLRVVD